MGSVPVSRLLSLAAVVAVVVVCAGSGAARPAGPQAVLTQATGDLHVANSQDGHAIFQASGLAPGGSVSGTVQLANAGSLPGDLGLEQLDVQDRPGAGGGLLSGAIHLDIADVTGGNSVPIFTGQLGGLGSRALGSIGPQEARTFRFTASLPDGGLPPSPSGGDNAYAGSGLTVSYAWNATTSGSIGPSEGSNPDGHGPITENRPGVKFRVDARRLLKRGWLDVLARCNRGCTLIVTAKAPKGTRVRFRERAVTLPLPDKRARIRLKLTRTNRHALLRALDAKERVVFEVQVKLVAAGWGPISLHGKKVAVMRPKRRRR
jgi:hypothetical protein